MLGRSFWYGLVICLIMLVGIGIYLLVHDPYTDFAARQLSSEIDYIVYYPSVSDDEVKVADREMIEAIRSWLLAAGDPGYKAYPSCPLIIFLKDGRVIALKISITESQKGTRWEMGTRYAPVDAEHEFVAIQWDGYLRGGRNPPFSDILTRTGERARLASQPNR